MYRRTHDRQMSALFRPGAPVPVGNTTRPEEIWLGQLVADPVLGGRRPVRRSGHGPRMTVAHAAPSPPPIVPPLPATNTRPSGAKRIAVGAVRPEKTTRSL